MEIFKMPNKIDLKEKIKQITFPEWICYLLSFFIFSGTNFLKFSIGFTNINVARFFMLLVVILTIIDVIKNKKIKDFIQLKDKYIKYCLIFFILWSLYSVISICWIKDLYMYIITNFIIITGTFMIIYFVKYINNIKILENILKIGIFTVTCNCIYYFFLVRTFEAAFYHNTNDLGTVLLFIISSIIYFIFKNYKENKKMIYYLIHYIICITAFGFINSRSCLLGLILGIIGFVFSYLYSYRKNIFKNKRIKVISVICFLIFIVLATFIFMKKISNISFKPVKVATYSTQVRINLIFNAIEFLKPKGMLLRGVGAGNSGYYYKNYAIYGLNETYSPHNFIIQILLDYGIFILLGISFVYLYIFFQLWKSVIKNKMMDNSSIFIFFIFSIIIGSIASSTLLTQEWFWLILAIIIAKCNFE